MKELLNTKPVNFFSWVSKNPVEKWVHKAPQVCNKTKRYVLECLRLWSRTSSGSSNLSAANRAPSSDSSTLAGVSRTQNWKILRNETTQFVITPLIMSDVVDDDDHLNIQLNWSACNWHE